MKKGIKTDIKTLEEWITSDDELPDSYNEQSEIPIYEDDERFDKIHFDWLYKKTINQEEVQEVNPSVSIETKEESINIQPKFYNDMLKKRTLKKKDIYCLQSVENILPGSVLLWFANFMMLKDMQSKYGFQKGCLVHDIFKDFERVKCTRLNRHSDEKCKYKIVLKNPI